MLCVIMPNCLGRQAYGRVGGLLFLLPVTAEDVGTWSSVGILVKWDVFLSSLHWPAAGADLGVGGVSFVEVLILYEFWAGERLELEKAVLQYQTPGRPISASAFPFWSRH